MVLEPGRCWFDPDQKLYKLSIAGARMALGSMAKPHLYYDSMLMAAVQEACFEREFAYVIACTEMPTVYEASIFYPQAVFGKDEPIYAIDAEHITSAYALLHAYLRGLIADAFNVEYGFFSEGDSEKRVTFSREVADDMLRRLIVEELR